MTLRRCLRLSIILIVLVLVTGATGFHVLEGWPWFDGLYVTLITMTTDHLQRLEALARV